MPFLGESHSQTQHLPNRKGGSNKILRDDTVPKECTVYAEKRLQTSSICSSCCVVANAAICKLDVQHILL